MLKPGVNGARINQIGDAQLFNVPQALKPWVRNDVEDKITSDVDEAVERIVDNFLLVQKADGWFVRYSARRGVTPEGATNVV